MLRFHVSHVESSDPDHVTVHVEHGAARVAGLDHQVCHHYAGPIVDHGTVEDARLHTMVSYKFRIENWEADGFDLISCRAKRKGAGKFEYRLRIKETKSEASPMIGLCSAKGA